MNSKCFNKVIGLQLGVAFFHYVLWDLVCFQCGIVLFIFSLVMDLLIKEIMCCSSLCFSDVFHNEQYPQALFSTKNDLLIFSM